MRKYLFLIVLITSVFFTACDDGSILESENSENNTVESNERKEVKIAELEDISGVEGILWASDSDVGVILAHGAIYDANSWQAQGQQFANENIVAFAVEDTNKDELITAANRLKDEIGVEKVVLVGASAGGASSIKAVKEDETVFDKVILLSPVGDATEIEGIPVFVIFSAEEGYEYLEASEAGNIRILKIPGSAHAQALFKDDEKSERVMEAMIDFINE